MSHHLKRVLVATGLIEVQTEAVNPVAPSQGNLRLWVEGLILGINTVYMLLYAVSCRVYKVTHYALDTTHLLQL